MGKEWDSTGIAFNVDMWREVFRVLKPGGHLLAFGGTRTYHRLAAAIEDAGFEIRDSIAWMHSSGFPKSLNVSKAIDKAAGAEREVLSSGAAVKRMIPGADQNATGSWIKDNGREFVPTVTAPATPEAARWEGFGTALKPAFEPIVVARKPLIGTVAQNVLAWGTGALNIDATRVPYEEGGTLATNPSLRPHINGGNGGHIFPTEAARRVVTPAPNGRWPANVILDEHAAAELDAQTGVLTSGKAAPGGHVRKAISDKGIYGGGKGLWQEAGSAGELYGDTGGASRFFYCAKAGKKERPVVDGVSHATVKPLALMRYLVRLVTPPGGTVLDPFAGSGTTGEACILEGFPSILIEDDETHIPLIEFRINRALGR